MLSGHPFAVECGRQGAQVGLGTIAVVGKSMRLPLPPSVLAEMFESVMGAVYVDGGLERCRAAYLHTCPMPATFRELTQSLPNNWGP